MLEIKETEWNKKILLVSHGSPLIDYYIITWWTIYLYYYTNHDTYIDIQDSNATQLRLRLRPKRVNI